MILDGRVWKIGDNVGATDLVPSRYDKAGMKRDWDECGRHLLEDVDPLIAGEVAPGDILVAGTNLGNGHAHYYMAAIKGASASGLSGLLAESVNTLFLRAAIDAGVTAWGVPGLWAFVETGDQLHFDLRTGIARNLRAGTEQKFPPISEVILSILDAGSSRNWALRSVGAERAIGEA